MEHPLFQLRRRHGLTQQACAKLMETPRSAISKIEASTRRIGLREAVLLMQGLRLTPEQALPLLVQLAGADRSEGSIPPATTRAA